MKAGIRAPRDLGAGLVFIGVGGGFLFMASRFAIGTSRAMGPGYIPSLLAVLLVGIGLWFVAASAMRAGPRLDPIAWVKLAVIAAAITVFALLFRGAGLIPSVIALVAVASLADRPYRPLRTGITAVLLAVGSWLVFTLGLGLQMPALGTWFEA